MAATNGKGLAEALVAIQAEAPKIPLDSTNPHFNSKFASLAGVMERVLPVTAKHGLAVVQLPTTLDGEPALTTRLIHSSGDQVETTMLLLPAKRDPQGQGSALTYARRYMVLSLLGLVGDEDDDGNEGSKANGRPTQTVDAKRVTALKAKVKEAGLKYRDLDVLLGAIGVNGLEANSAKAVEARFRSLSAEQADQIENLIAREAKADA